MVRRRLGALSLRRYVRMELVRPGWMNLPGWIPAFLANSTASPLQNFPFITLSTMRIRSEHVSPLLPFQVDKKRAGDGDFLPAVILPARRNHSSVFSTWYNKEWHHPDFMSYATVKAKEEWLESMFHVSNERHLDVEAFLVVLKALAETQDAPEAPRRAEHWMHRLRNHSLIHQGPTTECYQAVIQAWANSNKEQIVVIVNRAERWLNEMLENSKSDPNDPRIQPTIGCYNSFLDACTRGRAGKNKKNSSILMQNALKADSLLRRLHSEFHHYGGRSELFSSSPFAPVAPNTDSFNFVIRGWTRCKHDPVASKRVMSWLRLMESYQRSNPQHSSVKPNTKSYSMAMDALLTLSKRKAQKALEDSTFFNLDKSRNGLDEIIEAQAILTYMHDLSDAGVEGVVPHRVPYNLLISGWAGLSRYRHHTAPFQAEKILRTMLTHRDKGLKDAGPDRVSYEKVILAWAESGMPVAGSRASWWLKRLWNDAELQGDENLLPTAHTYNIVMQALAASDGPLAAENLLLDLGEKYRQEKTPELCPNSESFSIVIRAWLNNANRTLDMNERNSSLRRAVEWLSSLREVENEHNLSTAPELFQRVLKVARKCAKGRPEVLELATATFYDLKESRHGADYIAYAYLLAVGLEALSGSDADDVRDDFIQNIFKECCNDGLISRNFVQALVFSQVYETGWTSEKCIATKNHLFPTWPLPPSWSRNIPSERFHVRKIDLKRVQDKEMDHNSRFHDRKENLKR